MKFQILCLDDTEEVHSTSINSLIHALLGNDRVFKNCTYDLKKGFIEDKDREVLIEIKQFDSNNARYSVAFIITANCENETVLDDFRVEIVDCIKGFSFPYVRILLDEISESYANSLYIELYKLENYVRSFITSFFLKNLGPSWARITMPKETLDKIKERKNNERIFVASNKINSDVILIDFDDLGKILYNENSVLCTKRSDNVEALLDKIKNAIDLVQLKDDVLQGNFYKYFKDCFTQQDFQKKWTDLCYYRNKVAHNSYFTKNEVDECIQLCKDINSIIEYAYSKLDTFVLSVKDKEAVIDAVNSAIETETENQAGDENKKANERYINESTFLDELKNAQEQLKFVGLRHFVMNILQEKGYDHESSFALVDFLVDMGKIELDKIKNHHGDYETTTIKIA